MQFLPMADQQPDIYKKSFCVGDIVELDIPCGDAPVPEACCGGAPPPPSSPFERPGYQLEHYVRGFLVDERTDVAVVKTSLDYVDHLGTLRARIGIFRDDYRVAPGLYCAGKPDMDSPVLVTANYKLTFDSVRKELGSISCWILVLDTCGVNVWCAAGKKTFSTEEIIRQVEKTALGEKVSHRRLVVPQLGAPGVAAHEVAMKSGFRVVYGPILARNLQAFLENDMIATKEMRAVTFTLRERFVLIPVEFYLFSKKIWWIFPFLFVLSGFGPNLFSLQQSVERGIISSISVIAGGILGAVCVPLLLPWIPGRSFSFKGFLVGLLGSIACVTIISDTAMMDKISIVLMLTAVSSYLAMNFTGSTPYTTPSGVEKEMKIALPLQLAAAVAGSVIWLLTPFF